MHNPVFYKDSFPFQDPTVLVNHYITAAEVAAMHDQADVDGLSTNRGIEINLKCKYYYD